MSLLGVDVPPISNVTIWGSGALGFNKTAAIYCFATLATILLFYLGTRRKDALVPAGLFQNAAESGVAFVRNQVIMQTIGPEGLSFLPYLTALFFFIFFINITEIIPGVHFPANARFGVPLVLALMSWAIYIVVGLVKQGPSTSAELDIPPGVPLAIIPAGPDHRARLDVPRAAVLAEVRLFANMTRRPLILLTFSAIMTAGCWSPKVTGPVIFRRSRSRDSLP